MTSNAILDLGRRWADAELRGLDVILGKFVATSLPSFYCLLAVFPAMAVMKRCAAA